MTTLNPGSLFIVVDVLYLVLAMKLNENDYCKYPLCIKCNVVTSRVTILEISMKKFDIVAPHMIVSA